MLSCANSGANSFPYENCRVHATVVCMGILVGGKIVAESSWLVCSKVLVVISRLPERIYSTLSTGPHRVSIPVCILHGFNLVRGEELFVHEIRICRVEGGISVRDVRSTRAVDGRDRGSIGELVVGEL